MGLGRATSWACAVAMSPRHISPCHPITSHHVTLSHRMSHLMSPSHICHLSHLMSLTSRDVTPSRLILSHLTSPCHLVMSPCHLTLSPCHILPHLTLSHLTLSHLTSPCHPVMSPCHICSVCRSLPGDTAPPTGEASPCRAPAFSLVRGPRLTGAGRGQVEPLHSLTPI